MNKHKAIAWMIVRMILYYYMKKRWIGLAKWLVL